MNILKLSTWNGPRLSSIATPLVLTIGRWHKHPLRGNKKDILNTLSFLAERCSHVCAAFARCLFVLRLQRWVKRIRQCKCSCSYAKGGSHFQPPPLFFRMARGPYPSSDRDLLGRWIYKIFLFLFLGERTDLSWQKRKNKVSSSFKTKNKVRLNAPKRSQRDGAAL